MKLKTFFILFLLINWTLAFSQKEAANWFFGYNASLDFNSGTPISKSGKLVTLEGCASISNSQGVLRFYTDGTTIWDRNHTVMPNGSNLLGHLSSTQSAIIVPKPGNKNIYYVFTVDSADQNDNTEIKYGLNYSEIDMTQNGGFGAVTANKNKHLVTYDVNDALQSKWKCSEKIAAISHVDESSYWVVTHFVDTFYAFRVDINGVSNTPVKTNVSDKIDIVDLEINGSGVVNISGLGYLKISPNGEKIAIAHSSTANTEKSGKVILYDFNANSGTVVDNGILLLGNTYPYGLEFSPKSKKLYVSVNNYETSRGNNNFKNSVLYQFDLESSNIIASKKDIYSDTEILAGALQLAMDGKIYRAKNKVGIKPGEPSLAAINKPELTGSSCEYIHRAVDLKGGTFSGYGLPPFISSFFLFTFDFEHTCYNDATHFFITSDEPYDSLIWDFGDGTTSTENEPYHTYALPGTYSVELITTTDNIASKPVKKTIEIVELVETMESPYELVECDSNDSNPNDGITTYNLQLADDPISMGNGSVVDVYYYNDLTTLNSDVNNENSLPNIYTNTLENELIYAKVIKYNSDCYGTGSVLLKTTESIEFYSDPITGCAIGNGIGLFNLTPKKELIQSELGLSANTTITFHDTKEYASIGYQPFDEIYQSISREIYIRVENDDICYGIGVLDLQIYEFPEINLEEELFYCASEFPLKISAGIDPDNQLNYFYNWNTGDESHDIEITQGGIYNVLITEKINTCTITRNIVINRIEIPEIEGVEIETSSINNTALIHMKNDGEYLYALNDEYGTFQNESFYDNLSPGIYDVYVKDIYDCSMVTKQFYIFGFPKFFTPNNDGINDIWEIKGLYFDEFTYSNIYIYNRFGKHLVTINPHDGWDGFYNGHYLTSNDYWFTINVTDKENITTSYKGHFSLIRK